MKTFKEIEAFIREAMKKELTVHSLYSSCIQVVKENYKLLFEKHGAYLNMKLYNDKSYIGETAIYNLSEREDKEYDILLLDVKQYETDKIMNVFYNFFKEDDSKKTVDDLDDDE